MPDVNWTLVALVFVFSLVGGALPGVAVYLWDAWRDR